MNDDERLALDEALGELRLRYTPYEPTLKQEWFLLRDELEVFFGGAAGPGKTVGLLMAALQYADIPGYDALLLRPALTEFRLPGGLIELSHDWLGGTGAHWNGSDNVWRFPSGATCTFGYLSTLTDMNRYKGTAFSFVGWDELTSFNLIDQLYPRMFRVLRQPAGEIAGLLAGVPTRMRSASNPGGPGHVFAKTRFVDPESRVEGATFVPATIHDNPNLDYREYLKSLAHLPASERLRLIEGDWDATDEGELFQHDWFQLVDDFRVCTKAVRYWDLAGTEPSPANPDPDYTVGLRLELDQRTGDFAVRDIVRGRWAPGKVQEIVQQTAALDGRGVEIGIEQEPGSAGVTVAEMYRRHLLRGFTTRVQRATGSKEVRARPVAAAAENRLLHVVNGKNVREFIDECVGFPNVSHDDCVDALSGAHALLTRSSGGGFRSSVPRGRLPSVSQRRPATGQVPGV